MSGATAVAGSTRLKLESAKRASALLAGFSSAQKNQALAAMADVIEANQANILRANQEDIVRSNLAGAMRDRLLLTPARISAMAASVRDVLALPDPVNEILEQWTRPNGLRIRKVR
ncbi:MAG: gamma-glutamyl-phosphate reductase, partial [Acidobacteria bacterium]|nr:gamma-glutamyl-phosphate reductase [Acidobacteriota bacterium]